MAMDDALSNYRAFQMAQAVFRRVARSSPWLLIEGDMDHSAGYLPWASWVPAASCGIAELSLARTFTALALSLWMTPLDFVKLHSLPTPKHVVPLGMPCALLMDPYSL